MKSSKHGEGAYKNDDLHLELMDSLSYLQFRLDLIASSRLPAANSSNFYMFAYYSSQFIILFFDISKLDLEYVRKARRNE